jgi:23S rRNA A2030 N6-methylase RlmJ
MGNSGDLIKHGVLAEFVKWHYSHVDQNLLFFDPFGGRPWDSPINTEVSNRISNLRKCQLKESLLVNREKYLGSGHIVKNICTKYGKHTNVFTSDKDPEAKHDLEITGLEPIALSGFTPENGYSILDCTYPQEGHNLILIDPFYDLINIYQNIIPQISRVITKASVSIVLYVLFKEAETEHWTNFKEAQEKLINNMCHSISLTCHAIKDSSIKGESKFHSHVSLFMHKNVPYIQLAKLEKNIREYAKNLEEAIGHRIEFKENIIT